ncbi:universal stress protein [Planosporangium sp. 12N6]|uniref:universal stress protein n=1 Tax=Planosporangium spinosum TaxID=3402278 RepID=UPI003CEA4EF4
MATRTRPPVLVGLDGSPESGFAVDTAAAEACRRDLPLRLVCCSGPRGRHTSAQYPWHPVAAVRVLARTAERIHRRMPGLDVGTAVPGCDLGTALVDGSRGAALVVVSHRHTGGYDRLFDRWLSHRVLTHAHCPVLVARTGGGAAIGRPGDRPVLLGLDGSEHSTAAVPLAFEEAELRRVPLRAVNVHCVCARATAEVVRAGFDGDGHRRPGHDPAGHGAGGHSGSGYDADGYDSGGYDADGYDDCGYTAATAQACACDLVARALAGWADRYPRVKVLLEPVYAPDVAADLVTASAAADLVVVGTRGRTARTSLLPGSVTRALVQYAHCPVLVTHAGSGDGPPWRPRPRGGSSAEKVAATATAAASRPTVVALPAGGPDPRG